jgi:glycosyltransferase involved in cell wall biosynthesis
MKNQPLILGVDATNISSGGGLIHLLRLLEYWNPNDYQLRKIILWSSSATLGKLPNYPWIVKNTHPWLDRNVIWRFLWRVLYLRGSIAFFRCTTIFSPGGLFIFQKKIPLICMCQNLLPFDTNEILRFGFSLFTFKLILLRIFQKISLRFSYGVIFLSQFSRAQIQEVSGIEVKNYSIISHGVDKEFFLTPRRQVEISNYNEKRPFRLLCVSPIWPYKNYENVVLAISRLREAGYPVSLDIVGSHPHLTSYSNLISVLEALDNKQEYIHYHGSKTFKETLSFYHHADLFVFSSSCESFGQIITEAMASGLPIACSNMSSMAETLGDAAIYFDPFSSESLYKELQVLMDSPVLRTQIASQAYLNAAQYSWERCATETFKFIFNKTAGLN